MGAALAALVGLAGSVLLLALSGVLLARLRRGEEPQPRAAGVRGLDLLAAALIAVLAGAAAFAWVVPGGREAGLVARVAGYAGAMAAAAAYLALRAGRPGFLLPRARRRGWGWAARAWVAGMPGLLAVLWLNQHLLAWVPGVAPGSEALAGFAALSAGGQASVAVLAVGVMPALEEFLFRGHLFGHLAGRPEYGAARALLLSALVFAALHHPGMMLPAAYLGLLFGWIRWRGGDLRLAILAHALHNGAALAIGAAAESARPLA